MPDVLIKPGSTMPTNKSVQRQLAIQLAQTVMPDGKPAIDRRALLEIFEFPQREEIIERMGDGNDLPPPQGVGQGAIPPA